MAKIPTLGARAKEKPLVKPRRVQPKTIIRLHRIRKKFFSLDEAQKKRSSSICDSNFDANYFRYHLNVLTGITADLKHLSDSGLAG